MPHETKTLETPPLAPPLDASAITTQAAALLDQLERAVRNLRQRLQHVPADLDAAVDHVGEVMRGEDPFYRRQLAARDAALAEQALDAFDMALSDARAAVATHAGALRGLADTVAARRAQLVVLGDTDDALERALSLAQLTHGRLRRLVEQVEPWHSTAVEAVARLARATVVALRREQVAQLPAALTALKARREVLQNPDAHDQDACALLARMVERVGRPLPVVTVRWPTKGDPFAPPTLVEPETARG
jgi:hypothetical protein